MTAGFDMTTRYLGLDLANPVVPSSSPLTGDIDHLHRLVEAGAPAVVLPSLFEGFGMVLTEATARGLPIICTNGGAAAETVPDAAAIKVTPGAVEPLSTALRQVIGDPDLLAGLGNEFALGNLYLRLPELVDDLLCREPLPAHL